SLRGPLPCSVNAHLAPIIWQTAGVVERIHRAERELNVALRIDIVGCAKDHLRYVLHIAILIDDDDAFGKHRLPHCPYAVHYLTGVSGVGLSNRDDHQIME